MSRDPTGDTAITPPIESNIIETYATIGTQIANAVGQRISGQHDLVHDTLIGLLAEGHVLLEGVPGLGKTELVKAFAAAIGVDFGRVQFTPDLMPADIVGTQVLEEDEHGRRKFIYQAGPLFTNLLLADEVNRATPKTQSALLEAMQERSVTVGGATRLLPRPFLVMATQNPIELEGTYPLPEAQLDRFMMKISVQRPEIAVVEEILRRTTSEQVPDVPHVADEATITHMTVVSRQVPIASHLLRYVAGIVDATHPDSPEATDAIRRYVRWGASPRGAQSMVLAAKVRALLDGRPHVSATDIRASAPSTLRHRLVLGYEATADGVASDDLLAAVIERIPEPTAAVRGTP